MITVENLKAISPKLLANEDTHEAQLLVDQASQSTGASPAIALMQMMTGMWVTQSIYVAASLGIADLLTKEPKSVDEMAQAVGAQAPYLYRVLRALASVGIFTEVAPRQFGLTEMAEYLRSDVPGSLRALSRTMSDEWQWNCWGNILDVVKTGQPAMQTVYGVQDTFAYLTQNPQSGALFDSAMIGWCRAIHTAVVAAYDFSGIHTLVDIAGGRGTLLAAILAANPQLRGILFDLPQVVAGAAHLLASQGVGDRCEIVGGSFFEGVPSGGDAYILSHILHDWNDEDCIRMLKHIRKGIAAGGRLLIVEMVIPDGDTAHFGKMLDIEMMALFFGGKERTENEYRQLFAAAGFELARIIPTASPVSILEATGR